MSKRRINLDVPNLPDARICAWLGENGIDPSTVPAAQEVSVDGDQLTFVAFVQQDGHKVMDQTTSEHSWLKEIRTVTLVSAPETFGL